MKHKILASLVFLLAGGIVALISLHPCAVNAGGPGSAHDALHVLPPITHGNLTIFPVVGGPDYDTSRFLTLDEGIRAGKVVVTERGSLGVMIRRGQAVNRHAGDEVNQLVLVNDSLRPLLLLAGEIVTGGKQDRVIGSDRLVPPKSDPIDLSVFCVEPGRWVAHSEHFGSLKSQMAQPSVRVPAMAAKNQQEVWNQVAVARDAMQAKSGAGGGVGSGTVVGGALPPTTSYATTMAAPQVQETIDTVAGNYESLLRELRKVDAKGVVIAINGRLVWADLFASNDLLSRYWQKLARSYAAESLTTVSAQGQADRQSAQAFLDRLSGNREVIETEPGIFRRVEVTGDGYKVFTLTALMAKADLDVHIAKMTFDNERRDTPHPYGVIR